MFQAEGQNKQRLKDRELHGFFKDMGKGQNGWS